MLFFSCLNTFRTAIHFIELATQNFAKIPSFLPNLYSQNLFIFDFCQKFFIFFFSWLISLLFGVGSAFSNFFESAHSVIIIREDDLTINASRYYEEFKEDGLNGVEPSRAKMKRREIAGLPMNVICMLTIFILCYICLFTVLVEIF